MIAWLTVAALVAIVFASWSLVREWAFPPVLLGSVWAVTLSVYGSQAHRLHPLRLETGAMIVVGVLIFSVGALVPVMHDRARPAPALPPPAVGALPSGGWIVWAAVVGLPFFLLRIWELATSGPTENVAINLRIAISAADPSTAPLGLLGYLLTFSIFGTALHVLGLVRSTPWSSRVLFGVSALYALTSSGRTAFLLLVAAVGGGLAVSGRIRLRTFVAIGGGSFLLVFGLVAFIMNKGISESATLSAGLVSTFTEYLVGGTAGLNDYLATATATSADWGQNTFRTLFALLHRLGIGPEPRNLVQEFRNVPFTTNVYSVFRPYHADFGWTGVVGFQALFGLLHGVAFVRARAGRAEYTYAYALLLYPLIMQGFQDQYFSLLSTWVQALLLLMVAKLARPLGAAAPPA